MDSKKEGMPIYEVQWQENKMALRVMNEGILHRIWNRIARALRVLRSLLFDDPWHFILVLDIYGEIN